MGNYYADLARDFANDPEAGKRCATRLLAMKQRLAPICARRNDGNLLLATWNIRDFDSNKFGWGPRLTESLYYIAEIISTFDLVAVQEVNRDLRPLQRVMKILGREWDYIATDTTEGAGGNGERMAFLYNTEKVWFRKVAGEIVLPNGQQIVATRKVSAKKAAAAAPAAEGEEDDATDEKLQFARSPFLVAFQSGWFRFSLCTAHLYYGAASGEKLKQRIAEIAALVKFFADRQDSVSKQEIDHLGVVENYIVLGDFNVVSPEHETMKALKSHGFVVPDAIDGDKVRKLGDHFYDQIAVRVKDPQFKVVGGGIVHLFDDVFTDADLPIYQARLPARDLDQKGPAKTPPTPEALYRKWRTWQLSDHAPLWIEIATDYSRHYLEEFAQAPLAKPAPPA